jgi:hypothetical protein
MNSAKHLHARYVLAKLHLKRGTYGSLITLPASRASALIVDHFKRQIAATGKGARALQVMHAQGLIPCFAARHSGYHPPSTTTTSIRRWINKRPIGFWTNPYSARSFATLGLPNFSPLQRPDFWEALNGQNQLSDNDLRKILWDFSVVCLIGPFPLRRSVRRRARRRGVRRQRIPQ